MSIILLEKRECSDVFITSACSTASQHSDLQTSSSKAYVDGMDTLSLGSSSFFIQ